MPAETSTENWVRAYREAPEIFDAFCRAEDPDDRVTQCLAARADLVGRSVLEIGCGTGRYTAALAPRAGRYLGVERGARMLALARANLGASPAAPAFVCADARRLPLADGSFERVIAAWVVVHAPARDRARMLAEASRVLARRPGCGLWIVENHWSGEFQELRGPRTAVERARLQGLIDLAGFSVVDVVRTELRFPSAAEAERVLGYLCGDRVRKRLRSRPVAALRHDVVILHRPAAAG